MGDAVNLASRLEGANKAFGTRILVSGETARRCGAQIRFREIARVRVLGRTEPTTLMEPLDDGAQDNRAAFDAARALFGQGRFADAARAFAALEESDCGAALYRRRAEAMATDPPPAGWDGVIDLDRK
jgi:adenylate cyclase